MNPIIPAAALNRQKGIMDDSEPDHTRTTGPIRKPLRLCVAIVVSITPIEGRKRTVISQ
jgi:hypothetical protein